MRISLTQLRQNVNDFLHISGFTSKDAQTLTSLIVEQEMIGNQFSAVGELAGKHSRIIENQGAQQEELVVQKPALSLFKGNGRMAPLITADHLDEAVSKAKAQGIYAVGIFDSTYNEFFDVFCRRIAEQDCISLIVENGGPQGVTPFGGKKDVTGTNPLAYGIPTHQSPMIFDAATATHAYGRISQAKEKNEQLPNNAYVDANGNITTDPYQASAVLPFGGFKGYAINLLIEVLSGALVRGKSGLDQPTDSQRYIGTLIIIIDPSAFGELSTFKDATTKLAQDILAVPPLDTSQPVRVPGFRGTARKAKFLADGFIDIDDHDWAKFSQALAKMKVGT